MSTPTYTFTELAECAEREVKQREYVYPRRVAGGQMTQQLADRQTAMMREIAAHFRDAAEKAGPLAEGRLV